MTRHSLLFGAALPACFLASCASILSGGKDMVTINSSVADVRILIDGEVHGVNSVATALRRGHKQHTIRVEHDDYLPVEAAIDTKFDSRALLGILIDFGLITIPIDILSGNAFALSPSNYTVMLDGDRLVLDSERARRQRREAELAKQAQSAPPKKWSSDPSGGTLKN